MKQHKIFIDAGGWYGAYYLGMFHYMFEEFGTTIFEDVYFEGISAGSFTSGYCLATIYGCRDNRYWLELGQKRATINNNYGNSRLTFGMYQTGKLFYEQLDDIQRSKIREYYCGICMDSNLKPYRCEQINNITDYGSAVASSANIPGLGSLYAWKFRDVYLWDGYFNGNTIYDNLNNDCENILLITFDAKRIKPNPTYVILDLSEWTTYSILNSLLPSFFPQYTTLGICDDLFEQGYNDAKLHKTQVREKLTAFGLL